MPRLTILVFASPALRGLFQYGELQFGQTVGSPFVVSRATHVCSHRSHRQPSSLTFAISLKVTGQW
jgi:hypothetical protein